MREKISSVGTQRWSKKYYRQLKQSVVTAEANVTDKSKLKTSRSGKTLSKGDWKWEKTSVPELSEKYFSISNIGFLVNSLAWLIHCFEFLFFLQIESLR